MSEILTLDGEITGNIVQTHSITGDISSALSIQGAISPGQLAPRFPIYDGIYEVTPLAQLDIVLDTANKILQNNVTVNKIPYFQTSNLSGGYTATIG